MSILQIDTVAARGAARDASAAVALLAAVRARVVAASSVAALESETSPALRLLDETSGDATGLARVLGLTADRAEAADVASASMLDGWLRTSVAALRRSINDDTGASVRDVILGMASDDVGRDLWLSLTPEAARGLFAGLPSASRIRLVAADGPMLADTAMAAVVQEWKDGLDGSELRDLFTLRAMSRAGIDPERWDPTLGLEHNAATVEAAYEYYADLYRGEPERFWWTGMAALMGPSFYAGFDDLGTFARLLDAASRLADGPLGALLPGGAAGGRLAALGSRQLADELEWYQVRLLSMQRDIFVDMATAHEAYRDGGVDMIERLFAFDRYGHAEPTIEAWRRIDTGFRTGDHALVADGNAALLRREQQFVIADDYDRMRHRPITGLAVTYMMTAVGAPAVPGARTFAEVFPATVAVGRYVGTPQHVPEPPGFGWLPDVPLPHIGAEGTAFVETPLPDGNISVFDDRWALIERDTLPTYTELAAGDPDRILDALATPIAERAARYTIGNRLDELLVDWDVRFAVELEAGW